MARRTKERKPDDRRFVQVAQLPSLGVETSTGRAWVGVDQQVGHFSADALFALTDDEYAGALVDAWTIRGVMSECWHGRQPERLLFHPGGRSPQPEHLAGRRGRMLRPPFEGELWWHLDALAAVDDERALEVSRALSGGTALVRMDDDGVQAIALPLVGDGAYPRPAALVGGLGPGSDRSRVAAILGEPSADDAHRVEGHRVRARYRDDGLTEIVLERLPTPPAPDGPLGDVLAALGEPEEGEAFQVLAALAGGRSRRWAVSSGHPRRLLAFEGGVEVQVEAGRVLGVRIDLRSFPIAALLPGSVATASRAALQRELGAAVDVRGSTALHRFGRRELLVEHDGVGDEAAVIAVTAVLGGITVSPSIHRWRSGDFTRFLDVLGRPPSDPLVAAVRRLPGVDVREWAGVVSAVELRVRQATPGSFVDGMPDAPTRRDVPFGRPWVTLERDDVWDLDVGVVHVHAGDGVLVDRIVVCREVPPHLDVDRWVPLEDRGAWSTSGE
ncbi:hypothetical protein GCM10009846_30730 [Agrococcus versicolor]|uniref:Uncharacterized protein n=1 Tax=Agrococcus versicolor TaxID=501482 RepID=A0ABP5MT93_9MICO